MRPFFAEVVGTFFLVFAGTGAIIIDQISGGQITHAGVAAVFGLVVLAMIHTFGDVSGAHFNPAVTISFAAAGRFPWSKVTSYLGAQLSGALIASLLLRALFGNIASLGATLPSGSDTQSLVLEIVLTGILMLVIFSVSSGAKEKGITAGLAIGAVVGLEAMFAGPICGASMNPARSIGPAVVSGNVGSMWVYLIGPLLGSLAAVPLCGLIRGGSEKSEIA